MSSHLTKLVQFGGYLARTKDPPPGNTGTWRGLSRLTDINLGSMLARASDGCRSSQVGDQSLRFAAQVWRSGSNTVDPAALNSPEYAV